MKKISILTILLLITVVFAACSNNSYIDPDTLQNNSTTTACTKECLLVCGVDGVTYSNSCMAGDIDIAYETACNAQERAGCEDLGGKYLSDYAECEGISQASCEDLGGQFQECASACRHNEDSERMCTLHCVLVCRFH